MDTPTPDVPALLDQTIHLSRSYEHQPGMTPFGALVWQDGRILGTGVSSVVADKDPTSHAEVNAIRAACAQAGTHRLEGAILVSSAYPCPLCLMATVWAGITVIHYGAGLDASHAAGFEDDDYYRSLRTGPDALVRLVEAGPPASVAAAAALREWRRLVDAGEWA